MLGTRAMSWTSKKQSVVALFTTEAEYMAATLCVCQCFWRGRILKQIEVRHEIGVEIMCDSNSTIQFSKHPVFHGKSIHIDVRFHFLRDLVNNGEVQLNFCTSQDQIADIMTKALKLEQFEKLRGLLGVTSIEALV